MSTATPIVFLRIIRPEMCADRGAWHSLAICVGSRKEGARQKEWRYRADELSVGTAAVQMVLLNRGMWNGSRAVGGPW